MSASASKRRAFGQRQELEDALNDSGTIAIYHSLHPPALSAKTSVPRLDIDLGSSFSISPLTRPDSVLTEANQSSIAELLGHFALLPPLVSGHDSGVIGGKQHWLVYRLPLFSAAREGNRGNYGRR